MLNGQGDLDRADTGNHRSPDWGLIAVLDNAGKDSAQVRRRRHTFNPDWIGHGLRMAAFSALPRRKQPDR